MSSFARYLLFAWLAMYCTAGLSEPEKPVNLKAFSMNLHCLENDWQKRINTILDSLAAEDISVFAFQEVCIGNGQNQATYLLDKLRGRYPEDWTHQLVYTHRAWDRYDEYLMVIVRGRDAPAQAGTLPASALQRGFIAIRSGGIWVINIHLEYHPDNVNFRREQIEYLVDQFHAVPHIIMGDFNSSPNMDEQRLFHDQGYRAHFPGPTYPATRPEWAIDGFWVSRELQGRFPHMTTKSMFGPDSTSGVQSDHLGVMLTSDTAPDPEQ